MSYPDFKAEMKKAYMIVDKILEEYPIARDSDFALTWIVLRKHFPSLRLPALPDEVLLSMAGTITTLRRQRQVIQNENHRYPPTDPKIMRRRKQRAENFRTWFGASQGGAALERGDYIGWEADDGLRHSLEYWRDTK